MDERALIFKNLVTGVPLWQVMRDFRKNDQQEVMAIFRFVLQKAKSYCFERKMPPLFCDTIEETHKHRILLLTVLPKLNLNKPPKFSKIFNENFTHENASILGGIIPA